MYIVKNQKKKPVSHRVRLGKKWIKLLVNEVSTRIFILTSLSSLACAKCTRRRTFEARMASKHALVLIAGRYYHHAPAEQALLDAGCSNLVIRHLAVTLLARRVDREYSEPLPAHLFGLV